MRYKFLAYLLIMIPAVYFINCRETATVIDHQETFKKPVQYNFEFIAYNSDIDNPDMDKRCFYKVFIDKVEEGRTTTGLDSQKKYFKSSLEPNRHLLRIEKWVLDEKAGQYVKLNNIDQPKPNFFYFDLPEERVVTVELKVDKTGSAEYILNYERE